MRISIIVAMGHQRQIGHQGQIPWHLPADLQNFKKITMGHTLILGRKTFASIGKALPGRSTIVLTRDQSFSADKCLSAQNLEDALELAKNAGETEVFIAGGAEVYAQALPLAQRLYLSFVNYNGEADTFFPPYSTEGWVKTDSQSFSARDHQVSWQFEIWEKPSAF